VAVVDRNIAKKVVVRKKDHFFDRKLLWFTGLILFVTVLVYVYPPGAVDIYSPGTGDVYSPGAVDAYHSGAVTSQDPSCLPSNRSFYLELGHDLYARGIYKEAVNYYSRYLECSGPGGKSASLAYKAGDICKDKLKDYEQAAKFYLQVRYFDSKSPLLQKTGLRIVTCL